MNILYLLLKNSCRLISSGTLDVANETAQINVGMLFLPEFDVPMKMLMEGNEEVKEALHRLKDYALQNDLIAKGPGQGVDENLDYVQEAEIINPVKEDEIGIDPTCADFGLRMVYNELRKVNEFIRTNMGTFKKFEKLLFLCGNIEADLWKKVRILSMDRQDGTMME